VEGDKTKKSHSSEAQIFIVSQKQAAEKDSSREARCFENGLVCLSFPARLPDGIPDENKFFNRLHLLLWLTAIIRCWSLTYLILRRFFLSLPAREPGHVQLHSAVTSDERYLENHEGKETPPLDWLDVEWQR